MDYSLYVHIPFCVKKCHYCDFVSYPQLEHMHKGYVDALLEEMKLYRGNAIRTVYIGGGTPSCIDPILLSRIFEGIGYSFNMTHCVERGIESNPGTLSDEMISCLKGNGVNRLSIGLQSWNPAELKVLGRTHGLEDFIKSYERAREAGFENINVDLMFGIPGQSMKSWHETLERVTALEPEHISCYSLKIESGTVLYHMVSEGALERPDPELDRDMYHYGVEYLASRGYNRYEISNFAKTNRECIHNLAYWDNHPYIGLGAAAHSYDGRVRRWNTDNIEDYCNRVEKGLWAMEDSEVLSLKEQMFETIFLKLRTQRGMNFREFKQRFGTDVRALFNAQLKKLKENGLIENDEKNLWLTEKGIDLSNSVFVEFLI